LEASQFNVAAGFLGNLHTASLLRNGLRALPEALQTVPMGEKAWPAEDGVDSF
jgi:hypothetical protein